MSFDGWWLCSIMVIVIKFAGQQHKAGARRYSFSYILSRKTILRVAKLMLRYCSYSRENDHKMPLLDRNYSKL